MTLEETQIKKECFDKKFYSFGTVKIFEKRVSKYGFWLKSITFLGLVLPLALGTFVAAFSSEQEILKNILLPICGILTITQAILSLLSLSFKWDDNYSYAIGAVKNNTRLTNDFEQLSSENITKIKRDISRLRDEYTRQEIEDNTQNITDKEKRFAMRLSLFQYKCTCKTCNTIPQSLTASDCDTCGNF